MRLHPPFPRVARIPRAAAGVPAHPRWVRPLIPLLCGSVLVTLIMCCCASHGGPGDAQRRTAATSAVGSAAPGPGVTGLDVTGLSVPGVDAPGEGHSAAECGPGALTRLARPETGPPLLAVAFVTLGVAVVLSSVPLPAAPGVRGPPMRRYGRAVLTGLCRWRV